MMRFVIIFERLDAILEEYADIVTPCNIEVAEVGRVRFVEVVIAFIER